MIHNRLKFISLLLAPSGWRVRGLDWRLSQPGFDPSYGKLICLATLMSSEKTKQICLWMTIYIYIYICVFGHHFFINAYFIEQYRYILSTYFCICPFQLPNWHYGVQRELLDETPITNCYPNTFCPILGHHQRCVYCKNDMTFAYTLLLFKCLLSILACCFNVLFVSLSSCSC